GDDHLLAGEAPDARGLEPDMLDRAVHAFDLNRVAHDEGLVEDDRERGEEISEDVLDGERDGDAADAKSGDEGRDVDAEVLQRGDDQQSPEDEAPRVADRLNGG